MANVPPDILAAGVEAIREARWRNGDLTDTGLASAVLEATWDRLHGAAFGERSATSARIDSPLPMPRGRAGFRLPPRPVPRAGGAL